MAAPAAPPPLETTVAPSQAPCPSCGSAFVERFCARCGELQPAYRDHSIRAVVHQALEEFGHLDGKIPRTLWALLTKPGALTREFIAGGRQRFAKPLSLFLVLNLVFFLIQPYTGLLRYDLRDYTSGDGDAETRRMTLVQERLAPTHETLEAYRPRFDATLSEHKKSLLLFAVPVFAVAMAIIFFRTGRPFMEHLVFAVHSYCFVLVVLTVGVWAVFKGLAGWVAILSFAGVPTRAIIRLAFGEDALIAVIVAFTTSYIALALRRAYELRWMAALPAAIVLGVVQMQLVILYRDLLFYTALYSTT